MTQGEDKAAVCQERDNWEAVREREDNISRVFGEPDAITGYGNRWYVIDSAEKSALAGDLGRTAVDRFWNGTRKSLTGQDSHSWLIMIDEYGRGVVTMAARKAGMETSYQNLDDCHVTGFENENVFFQYENDIRDLCHVKDLVCYPNRMGREIERPDIENGAPGPL